MEYTNSHLHLSRIHHASRPVPQWLVQACRELAAHWGGVLRIGRATR